MQRLTELDAVNIILRRLGEQPVTNLDVQYPTIAIALPALDEARVAILQEGWWFNSVDEFDFYPHTDGTLTAPDAMLMFYPEDPETYLFDGVRVVDAKTLSPNLGVTVRGRAVFSKEFEELPNVARYAVTYRAAYETYISDFGDSDIAQSILLAAGDHYSELSAAHTRQRKTTSRRKKQVARWRNMLRA